MSFSEIRYIGNRKRETNLKASWSTAVLPRQVAPPSTRVETTGHVEEAASWVLTKASHVACNIESGKNRWEPKKEKAQHFEPFAKLKVHTREWDIR